MDQPFITLTHRALFAGEPTRCDACGGALDDGADDAGAYAVRGSGLYVWKRGSQVSYEEPPLCASCAAAVGVSALARWEIEEEEG